MFAWINSKSSKIIKNKDIKTGLIYNLFYFASVIFPHVQSSYLPEILDDGLYMSNEGK